MAERPKTFSGKVLPPHLASWRVICLYGDDNGLISQRAQEVVKDVVGASEDPFRIVTLDKQDHDRLASEFSAISMLGGQRVIRVREAGEDIRKRVQQALTHQSDNVLVLQTQNIVAPSRSSLCRFLSKQDKCALVKCYKETGQNLQGSIRRFLAQHGCRMDHEGMAYFLANADSDNAIVRSELEKLLLYVYPRKEITFEDVRLCIGDTGTSRLDDIAYESLSGNVKKALKATGRAYQSGQNSISIIRTVLSYIQRLQRMRARRDEGEPVANLVRGIHFMRRSLVSQTLSLWTFEELTQELAQIQQLEMTCKQTGAPAEALCRQHVLILAQRASQKRAH